MRTRSPLAGLLLVAACFVCFGALVGCGGGGGGVANRKPVVEWVTSSASVAKDTWFTSACTYSDPDGAADLASCKFGIVPDTNRVCFKYSRSLNRLFAFDSVTSAWTPVGGIVPGTSITLESTDAYLDCAGTTVSSSGNSVVVDYKIKLKPAMVAGIYYLGLQAVDAHGLLSEQPWTRFDPIVVQ
jgi:hypothetical protein